MKIPLMAAGGGIMFDQDDKTNADSTGPSLAGPPMNGVSAAADVAAPTGPPVPFGTPMPSPTIITPSPSAVAAQRPSSPPSAPAIDEYLLTIKQQALAQLSPLVDKLDQTPEEKFRLTMTMIQASDDHSLIKSAYEAAQKITDEKVRAESLLAVVNEVNYFSQKAATVNEPA